MGAMKDLGSGGSPQRQDECEGLAYYLSHKLNQYTHTKCFFLKVKLPYVGCQNLNSKQKLPFFFDLENLNSLVIWIGREKGG